MLRITTEALSPAAFNVREVGDGDAGLIGMPHAEQVRFV